MVLVWNQLGHIVQYAHYFAETPFSIWMSTDDVKAPFRLFSAGKTFPPLLIINIILQSCMHACMDHDNDHLQPNQHRSILTPPSPHSRAQKHASDIISTPPPFVRVTINNDHKLYTNQSLGYDEEKLLKSYLMTYFGLRVATKVEGNCTPKLNGWFEVTRIN